MKKRITKRDPRRGRDAGAGESASDRLLTPQVSGLPHQMLIARPMTHVCAVCRGREGVRRPKSLGASQHHAAGPAPHPIWNAARVGVGSAEWACIRAALVLPRHLDEIRAYDAFEARRER